MNFPSAGKLLELEGHRAQRVGRAGRWDGDAVTCGGQMPVVSSYSRLLWLYLFCLLLFNNRTDVCRKTIL